MGSKKTKIQSLLGAWGKQRMGQWGSCSFPDLSNTNRFSKLGELVGYSVVIPFQMMETSAAEMEQRAMDSTENMFFGTFLRTKPLKYFRVGRYFQLKQR